MLSELMLLVCWREINKWSKLNLWIPARLTENVSFSIFCRATSSLDCSSDTAGSNGGWHFNIFVSYVMSSRIGYLLYKQYSWGKRVSYNKRNKLKVNMKHCNPFYLHFLCSKFRVKQRKVRRDFFFKSFLKSFSINSILILIYPLLFQIYRYLLFLL